MPDPDPAAPPDAKKPPDLRPFIAVFIVLGLALIGATAFLGRTVTGETTVPPAPPAAAAAEPAAKEPIVQLAEAELLVKAKARAVNAKVEALRREMDKAAEGIETTSEVMMIAKMFQDGEETMAQHLMEDPKKYRSMRYRQRLIEIRDARRDMMGARADFEKLRKQMDAGDQR